jgi:hypothetical protein
MTLTIGKTLHSIILSDGTPLPAGSRVEFLRAVDGDVLVSATHPRTGFPIPLRVDADSLTTECAHEVGCEHDR